MYLAGIGGGHLQSIITAALLLGLGALLFLVGLIADLISVNRKLLEKLDWKMQKLEEQLRSKDE
jgi:hypothetical protein